MLFVLPSWAILPEGSTDSDGMYLGLNGMCCVMLVLESMHMLCKYSDPFGR